MNKKHSFLPLLLITLFTISACVEDDNYNIPNNLGNEENIRLTKLLSKIESNTIQLKTINEVKALFKNGEAKLLNSEIAVKGYVSSSDQTGNFYKEFFIQDHPETPTSALKIAINQADTYNQFNLGREVYIYLKDLYIGETNASTSKSQINVITIGGKYDDFNGDILEITKNQIGDHILRSSATKTIIPLNLKIPEITASHVGMYVTITDVQFPLELEGKPYVNPTDDYDSQRYFTSCEDNSSFILESSAFANFSNETIPTNGKGNISGIINSTYNGYDLVLNLNTTNDVIMKDTRCDPIFFETFSQGNLNNWTTYSVTGKQKWYYNNYGNPNDSATISGYGGGNQNNENWLISKAIDLTGYSTLSLSFQSVVRYSGPKLKVYMCTNYNGGNPTTDGNWSVLNAVLDTNTGSWSSWTESGNIDISSGAGKNVFIAFKYTSTTSGASTYEIDNIKIEGE